MCTQLFKNIYKKNIPLKTYIFNIKLSPFNFLTSALSAKKK